ncbi:transposable element Tc1 transposase [Trichonephila clavipes]|nr:transposable element Tc1 transposase [Trichonephila clavipes]
MDASRTKKNTERRFRIGEGELNTDIYLGWVAAYEEQCFRQMAENTSDHPNVDEDCTRGLNPIHLYQAVTPKCVGGPPVDCDQPTLDVFLGYSRPSSFHLLPKLIWCGSWRCNLGQSLSNHEPQVAQRTFGQCVPQVAAHYPVEIWLWPSPEGARVLRNSSTVMRVWKQWTVEPRITRKTGSGRRKVTSEDDDRHLFRMAGNDRTASSKQLAARWSTATGVLMSASSIRRRLLHRGLCMNHSSICGENDGRIRVRRNTGERYLLECVIERHSGLTIGVMGWGTIPYHERSSLLRTEDNLNRNRYVREGL